ncbi:protein NinD [Serratia sp. 14-2641]|uniref:protein NinD n=1 Tax=Serratia sp. 14-2641 TaxID=1841657 RepID=UPI000944701B|nr:protein NinD [Serratia sp. 14-2641]
MKSCSRCGEIKDDYRFRPGQKYWVQQCMRCERTPVGEMPYRQTEEDIWREPAEAQRK